MVILEICIYYNIYAVNINFPSVVLYDSQKYMQIALYGQLPLRTNY